MACCEMRTAGRPELAAGAGLLLKDAQSSSSSAGAWAGAAAAFALLAGAGEGAGDGSPQPMSAGATAAWGGEWAVFLSRLLFLSLLDRDSPMPPDEEERDVVYRFLTSTSSMRSRMPNLSAEVGFLLWSKPIINVAAAASFAPRSRSCTSASVHVDREMLLTRKLNSRRMPAHVSQANVLKVVHR